MGQGDKIRRHQGGLTKGEAHGTPKSSAAGRRRRRADARAAQRVGARLSDAAGAHRRRLSAGPVARHHRAPHRPGAVGAARPAIHRRQPPGRGQQYRHRSRRSRDAGRLYAAADRLGQCHQRHALSASEFRFRARPHAGRRHRPHAFRHRGQSAIPGQIGARADRLCQGQSRQDQHRVGRRRHRAACRLRIVQDDDRHRHGAGAVQGQLHDRSARRTNSDRVRADRANHRGRQRRQAHRHRTDHADAFGRRAGHSGHRRIRAGLCGGRLVRHLRDHGHAGRDRREIERGDQCRRQRSRPEGQVAEPGRGTGHDVGCGVQEICRRRKSPNMPR